MLRKALRLARMIGDEEQCAKALIALAPKLPVSERAQAFNDALDHIEKIGNADMLAAVAPQLPDTMRERALSAARTMVSKKKTDVGTLATLASLLPEPERSKMIEEGLRAGRSTQDDATLASALTKLAQCLPQPKRVEVLREALESTKRIREEWDGSSRLVELASRVRAFH
jgi:hypothetical protein